MARTARLSSVDDLPLSETRESSGPRGLLWLLLLVAAVPRVALMPFNENLYGDAVVRTELAEKWAHHPHWIASFDDGAFQFGPLHLYLVGLAFKLWPHREHAGRGVSLLFGVATVWPLYRLSRLFFDWKAGLWACLAFSVWGIHLQASTTAASESLGLFLIVAMLWSFARGMEENRLALLIVAAGLLNLAAATRYDAWMLIPLLAGVLAWADRDRLAAATRAVVFTLFCLPFPLVWMQGNALARGEALWPMHFIDQFHRAWFATEQARWGTGLFRLYNLAFWPGTALLTLTPLVAIFGVAGLVQAHRRRPELRWWTGLLLVPTVYFTVRGTVLGTFVPLARFTVVQLVMLLPFVHAGFEALTRGRSLIVRRSLGSLAVATAVGFPLWLGLFTYRAEGQWQDWLRPVSPTSTNSEVVRNAAQFIREQISSTGKALILDSDPNYLELQVGFFGGLPRDRMAFVRHQDFSERLRELEPGFLLRADRGLLERLPGTEIEGARLHFQGAWFEPLAKLEGPLHFYRRVEPAPAPQGL